MHFSTPLIQVTGFYAFAEFTTVERSELGYIRHILPKTSSQFT